MNIKKPLVSPLILLLILIIPAFVALLKPGYYNMHDDMQMIRQLELEKCIKDGQIPCRWSPDLGYEYGYPLFNFYPPLPYIVGQVFRTLGFSFMWSVKLTALLQFILAAVFMYLFALSLLPSWYALIASLFYVYAPYRAINIYIRAAMNEAWANVFFPLIFLFIKKNVSNPSKKNIILLGLSIVGLMLSHNPMLLVFGLFCIPWLIFCLFNQYRQDKLKHISKILLSLGLSGVLALGIAAYYTLPVLFETKLTHIDSMFVGYYSHIVHYVSLFQLFISNFWGDGASVWGTEDAMPFMVGYIHWLVPVIYLFFTFVLPLIKKTKPNIRIDLLMLISLSFISIFMTHARSNLIWTIITPIQKIQFPWRFLNLSIFFLSISSAYVIYIWTVSIKKQTGRSLLLVLSIITLLFVNFSYFKPITSGPLTDQQKFSGLAWQNQVTSGIYDYLPITAQKAPVSKANYVVDLVEPQNSANVYGAKKGTDWLFFNASVFSDSTITLAQMYFPNFTVTNFGKPIPFSIEPEFGRMVLNLPPGNYQIYVKLKNTPIRNISNYISLFTIGFLLFSLLSAKKRQPN